MYTPSHTASCIIFTLKTVPGLERVLQNRAVEKYMQVIKIQPQELLTVPRRPDNIGVALNKKSAQKQKDHLKQRLLASRCSTKKTKTPFQKTTQKISQR